MSNFVPRKLNYTDGLGKKLQQARLLKGLKIETISQDLNIRIDYLLALEEEDFNNLPTGLYGSNYLKKYSDYLKLDSQEMLELWHNSTKLSKLDNPFSQKIIKKSKLIVFPKIVRNVLIGVAVLICFLYLIFYFQKIVFPPYLEISQPNKNLSITKNYITITGKTAKEASVTINGETVLNNHDGSFSQLVNLKKGLNEIIIRSRKKYSREKTIIRQILVK